MLDEVHGLVARLLHVPPGFTSLLLPGGGSQQFAIAALNLRGVVDTIRFLVTDHWTERARQEFSPFLPVIGVAVNLDSASSVDNDFGPNVGYFVTSNNTAAGTRWPALPALPGMCRIADMSSDLFGRRPQFGNFELILACAQKNFGVAGLSLVLIADSLLSRIEGRTSGVFSYSSWKQAGGLYNTFPVVQLAITLEMLRFINRTGGVEAVEQNCRACSDMLYEYLENSTLFEPQIGQLCRSIHNVTFRLRASCMSTEHEILSEAGRQGVIGLKGHPTVGGFRASFYAGADVQDAAGLISFLTQFERRLVGGIA